MPSVSIPAAIASIGTTLTSAIGGIGGASAIASGGLTAAASASPWLAYAGIGSSLAGGALGAYGSYMQGQSAAAAARYNATIEKNNATIAKQNAAIAGEAGSFQAYQVGQKTRSEVGTIAANQAAGGIDVNKGSAVDVRSSAAELGELDALTVRSNAAREAYGYQTQADTHTAQSNLDLFEAANDQTAGTIGAASTFLGSAGSAALNFRKYQLEAGGLGG
jgi:hypothetical protein